MLLDLLGPLLPELEKMSKSERRLKVYEYLNYQSGTTAQQRKLYRTPAYVAKLLAEKAVPKRAQRILDLFAGEGDLTKFLPATDLTAVEIEEERVRVGRERVANANWLCADICSEKFQREILQGKKFDCVVMNPPFKQGMTALALASDLIKGEGWKRVVAILPSNYFETRTRSERFGELNLAIWKEFKLGNVPYLDGSSTPKPTPDSIFVFRRTAVPTYNWQTSSPYLNGELRRLVDEQMLAAGH